MCEVPALSNEVIPITVEDLVKLLKAESEVDIIDVRGPDFLAGHIPGSRHIPTRRFDQNLHSLAAEVAERGCPVVFMCMSGEFRSVHCAKLFAGYLQEYFSSKKIEVWVLKGGYVSWDEYFATSPERSQFVSKVPCKASEGWLHIGEDGTHQDLAPAQPPRPTTPRKQLVQRISVPNGGDRQQLPGRPARSGRNTEDSSSSMESSMAIPTADSLPELVPVTRYSPTEDSLPELPGEASDDSSSSQPTSSSSSSGLWRSSLAPGSKVLVRSGSLSRWVDGTIINQDDCRVKVHYEIDGVACLKVLPKSSRELKDAGHQGKAGSSHKIDERPTDSCSSASATTSQPSSSRQNGLMGTRTGNGNQMPPWVDSDNTRVSNETCAQELGSNAAVDTAPIRGRLSVGSTVSVRSLSARRLVEGVVTAFDSEWVKVQYFVSGRSCTKAIPRHSVDPDSVSDQQVP